MLAARHKGLWMDAPNMATEIETYGQCDQITDHENGKIYQKEDPETAYKYEVLQISWTYHLWKLWIHKHAVHVINKSLVVSALLRPVLSSTLPIGQQLGIYKAYIWPHLTCTAPAWYQLLTNKRLRNRIEVQHNKALSLIVDPSRYMKNSALTRNLQV